MSSKNDYYPFSWVRLAARIVVGAGALAIFGCEGSTEPSDGHVLWAMRDLGAATTTPLVTDDLVIAGVRFSNVVYAVDRSTGDLVWQQSLELPQTVVGGRVLLGSTEFLAVGDQIIVARGWLHSLDRNTGEVVWSLTPEDGELPGNWAVMGDGVLFAAGSRITALVPSNGEVLYHVEVGEYPFAPIYEDGILYFGGRAPGEATGSGVPLGEGHAMAVDAATGEVIWKVSVPDNLPLRGGVTRRGVLSRDIFVIAGLNGRIYGINRWSGEVLWVHEGPGPFTSHVQLLDEVVVIGGTDGVIRGLDLDTGALLWANGDLPGSISAAARAESHALVAGGRVRAIDAQGRVTWGYGGAGWEEPTTRATPAWAPGTVYLASEAGLLAVRSP